MTSRAACLLLHGFGGGPFEMLPLARALEGAGFAVLAPALPGHAESFEAFARTRWSDWFAAAQSHYRALAARHDRVVVVGQSMGGSLALRLAQTHEPAGVCLLATPIYLYSFHPLFMRNWLMPLMGVLRKVRPVWKTGAGDPRSREIAPWEGYEGAVPLETLYSFDQALREVRRDLERITVPLLALHAGGDRSVAPACSFEIVRRVSSPLRRLAMLRIEERVTSRHVLTTHREVKDTVARLCVAFSQEACAGA